MGSICEKKVSICVFQKEKKLHKKRKSDFPKKRIQIWKIGFVFKPFIINVVYNTVSVEIPHIPFLMKKKRKTLYLSNKKNSIINRI